LQRLTFPVWSITSYLLSRICDWHYHTTRDRNNCSREKEEFPCTAQPNVKTPILLHSPVKHLELHEAGLLEMKVYLSFNFLSPFQCGIAHGHAELK